MGNYIVILFTIFFITACSQISNQYNKLSNQTNLFIYGVNNEEKQKYEEEYKKTICKAICIGNTCDYDCSTVIMSLGDFIDLRKDNSISYIKKINKEYEKCNSIYDMKSCNYFNINLIKFEQLYKQYNNKINIAKTMNNCQFSYSSLCGFANTTGICNKDTFLDSCIDDTLLTNKQNQIAEKQKEARIQKEERETQAYIASLQKQFNLTFCELTNWLDKIPSNCFFYLNSGKTRVSQQIKQGTLITAPSLYNDITFVLIEKNNIDGGLVDNSSISEGFFIQTGTFQYKTVLGANKTIYKIKRLK